MDSKFHKKNKSTGENKDKVLIPVDFSPKGSLAINVGFELARRLRKEIVLLHASVIANPAIIPQFPDDFNGLDNESSEIEEMELEQEVHQIDVHSMDDLKNRIETLQKSERIPQINFSTVLAPGMPEEVISEYCSLSPPAVIVMATRGCEKRKEELVGSVTAEVIDHAVAPVFTVPEDYTFNGFKQIVRICAFCYFDDGDFTVISRLMEMFDNPEVKIYLFPATDRIKGSVREEKLISLQSLLSKTFPNSEFCIGKIEDGLNIRQAAENLFIKESIQMILAPNRKRNAISRFFNPGLAHKILYEIDFPMLAIPVDKLK